MIAEVLFTADPQGGPGTIATWIAREKEGGGICPNKLCRIQRILPYADIRPSPSSVRIIIDFPSVTTEQVVRRAGGLAWLITSEFRVYADLCPVKSQRLMLRVLAAD